MEVFLFPGKGVVPGTGPGILHSGEAGCLLAGTQRPVSCLCLPLIARFRHRTRVTCALKSTGVAYSQQASLRQDIAPVILQSWVPRRPEPYSEPEGGPIPLFQTGVWCYRTADFLSKMEKLWDSDGVLELEEPGALMFPEEELKGLMRGNRSGGWWPCFPPGFLCWRSGSEAYNGNCLTILMDDLSGNAARLPVSVVYDEYQKAIARKRRPSYTPLPRLARAALSANGLSSTSSTSVEVGPNRDPLVVAHRRLIGEVFLLRGQMQDMVARRDLLVQQVKAVGKKIFHEEITPASVFQVPAPRFRVPASGSWVPAPRTEHGSLVHKNPLTKASARWELVKEWLEKCVEHWNPKEEYRRQFILSGGINHQSGSFSQAATPRSVVGSRFSEEPSF
ncbi:hypothetical protein HID58_042868 [Brassica napus]|uniref:Uncharacterized protein n=1 Tax=Brassica napus TaxID=3708 RepID=A0ABQ8BEV1_BRANA|nr:hypothetical protein HID58_042868 [Brassica napus]